MHTNWGHSQVLTALCCGVNSSWTREDAFVWVGFSRNPANKLANEWTWVRMMIAWINCDIVHLSPLFDASFCNNHERQSPTLHISFPFYLLIYLIWPTVHTVYGVKILSDLKKNAWNFTWLLFNRFVFNVYLLLLPFDFVAMVFRLNACAKSFIQRSHFLYPISCLWSIS